jgi:hypothetical protein
LAVGVQAVDKLKQFDEFRLAAIDLRPQQIAKPIADKVYGFYLIPFLFN